MTVPMDDNVSFIKNYFDSSYEAGFPLGNFFVDIFHALPSNHTFSDISFKKQVIDVISALPNFNVIFKRTGDRNGKHCIYNYVFLNEVDHVIIEVFDNTGSDENDMFTVKIFYDGGVSFDLEEICKQINLPKLRVRKKGNITLIRATQHGLSTVDFELRSQVSSVELCYGEEFVKVHKHILESLNKMDSKGIILLHGDPGTGKSHYLRHLSTLIKNKTIMWLPQTAADSLCSPEFITFLMNNKNSVLIIEDGERVIKDREGFDGSSNAVSNLLNLTDGILSDCLHIQVVATFNTDIKNIDKALMRKGRLIVDYEFSKLSVEGSNKLLKYLNKDHQTTVEMTLADIYNIDAPDLSNHKKRQKIGFNK
jgi:hypothetical protein